MFALFIFGLSLRTFDLPAKSAPPNAQAQLIAVPSLPTGLLRVNGLKTLGADETYEVWLIRGGKPEPALMFNVDSSGSANLLVRYDEPIGNIEQMGITIERAGGSASPSQNAFVFYGALH
jgi:anti-sigma-K factor RskA